MSPDATTPRSYLDFAGLGQLRAQAAQQGDQALRETARQFEAMFIQMTMKSMRDAVMRDEDMASSSMDTYQDMMDREVAVQMAQRGVFGVADMLERHMQQREQALSTEAVLRQRALPAEALPLKSNATPLPLQAPAASAPAAPTRGPVPLPLDRQTGLPLHRSQP